ncbi:hypothetical protein EYF80_054937 [Liparis tanakae]|uniref:Uncharacterized protein n=1 Tax=Liparis tanakae TaxID=230148 RepID=A0A4Z2F112_9TELE|nr:hypothetical protein EYF80_054937 [Liparis tanakae]
MKVPEPRAASRRRLSLMSLPTRGGANSRGAAPRRSRSPTPTILGVSFANQPDASERRLGATPRSDASE